MTVTELPFDAAGRASKLLPESAVIAAVHPVGVGAILFPYRRKAAVFESSSVESPFRSVFASQLDAEGVAVSEVVTDLRDPERRGGASAARTARFCRGAGKPF